MSNQSGVGLIEVLASMLILGVGVLGMISVQSRSVQFNQAAMFESQAINLAGDIIDRMRAADPDSKLRYRIDFNDPSPSYTSCDGNSANCTTNQLADYDVATWRAELAANLPQGNGEIALIQELGALATFVIIIQYQDNHVEASSASGQNSYISAPKQVSFQTSI